MLSPIELSGLLVVALFWSCYTIKPRFGREYNHQRKMKSSMKSMCILGFLMIVAIANLERAYGAGECGKSSPDMEAWKLAPCGTAAQDEHADVSSSCCAQVKKIGQNPSCLCAVMLSNTAKMSGADPAIAVTIPKRCNLANRPIGMKCGGEVSCFCFHFCFSYLLLLMVLIYFLIFLSSQHIHCLEGMATKNRRKTWSEDVNL